MADERPMIAIDGKLIGIVRNRLAFFMMENKIDKMIGITALLSLGLHELCKACDGDEVKINMTLQAVIDWNEAAKTMQMSEPPPAKEAQN